MEFMNIFPQASHLFRNQSDFPTRVPVFSAFWERLSPISSSQAKLACNLVLFFLSNVFLAITRLLRAQATNSR
jgi:hypothetical protein